MLFLTSHLFKWSFIASLFVLFAACSTGPEPIGLKPGTFQKQNVPADTIHSLHKNSNILYAATDEGLFRKKIANNAFWEKIGLDFEDAAVWDLVFWNDNVILAKLRFNFNQVDSTAYKPDLYKSSDGGTSWEPIISVTIIDGQNYKYSPPIIEKMPTEPLTLIGASVADIFISLDSGKTWRLFFNSASSVFLKVSTFYPGVIWTGGQGFYFTPTLAKSTDGGKTWVRLGSNIFEDEDIAFVEGTVHNIILSVDNPEHVLIGVLGLIRKSLDGGYNWSRSLTGIGAYTFTHSIRNPKIVYASGVNEEGTLFFVRSNDFGENWKWIRMENSPANIYVKDMISIIENGHEVIYFATNKGVYSHTLEE